jgi:hypothetical protein
MLRSSYPRCMSRRRRMKTGKASIRFKIGESCDTREVDMIEINATIMDGVEFCDMGRPPLVLLNPAMLAPGQEHGQAIPLAEIKWYRARSIGPSVAVPSSFWAASAPALRMECDGTIL